MAPNTKRLAEGVAEISTDMVKFRRSMMVFRARMGTVEAGVSSIGDKLDCLDKRFGEIRDEALRASATCRDTVGLCDQMLALAGEDQAGEDRE